MKILLFLALLLAGGLRPTHAQAPQNPRLESLRLNLPGQATPAIAVDGPTLADSLTYLLRLAAVDFRGLRTGEKTSTPDNPQLWQVPRLLGASATFCYEANDNKGLLLRLDYASNNRRTKPVTKALQAWLAQLASANQGTYQLIRRYPGTLLLECHGRLVVRYDAEEKAMSVRFFQNSPIMADEAVYQGRFPVAPTASAEPQIWEVRGGGTAPGSYVRYNGLVKNGKLARGTQTYHGYDDFYEGTWFSDSWQSRTTYFPAQFYPAGTQDTVWLHIDTSDVFSVIVDGRSTHRGSLFANIKTPIPTWVTTPHPIHAQVVAARTAAAQAEYQRQHPVSEQRTPYSERSEPSYSRPASAPAYQPTDHQSTCIACGGRGWVDGSDGLGHSQRQQCSSCHGSGHVTNRY